MDESQANNRTTYVGVGAAFFALAAAMSITMDSWVIALPFAVLAFTFVMLGVKPAPDSDRGQDDAG